VDGARPWPALFVVGALLLLALPVAAWLICPPIAETATAKTRRRHVGPRYRSAPRPRRNGGNGRSDPDRPAGSCRDRDRATASGYVLPHEPTSTRSPAPALNTRNDLAVAQPHLVFRNTAPATVTVGWRRSRSATPVRQVADTGHV
jgi:hypothetical protein